MVGFQGHEHEAHLATCLGSSTLATTDGLSLSVDHNRRWIRKPWQSASNGKVNGRCTMCRCNEQMRCCRTTTGKTLLAADRLSVLCKAATVCISCTSAWDLTRPLNFGQLAVRRAGSGRKIMVCFQFDGKVLMASSSALLLCLGMLAENESFAEKI